MLVSVSVAQGLRVLLADLPPLTPGTTGDSVYDYFASHKKVQSLAVVDQGKPVGLVNRHKLVEQFSRRFFREVYGRKPITSIMDTAPLVVEETMSIEDVARIVVEDEDRYLYEGFIITRQGLYQGMGTGHALLREVSERQQAYLHHLASHDTLTGLPNRQLFGDRLGQALREAQREGRLLAVLYVDLDRFKEVNDSLGHPVGDLLLVEACQRLRQCLRSVDTLARLGGDEFAVVLARLARPEDAAIVAERMRAAVAEPFVLEGHRVQVSASIGIGLSASGATNAETLVRNADAAVYQAKQGRNRFVFFEPPTAGGAGG